MASEYALQRAAQAWCGSKTRNKVMDPELAMEFAEIIDKVINIRMARHTFRDAFAADPAFRKTYQDNIAMCLFDGGWVTDYEKRNAAADAIIHVVFESLLG